MRYCALQMEQGAVSGSGGFRAHHNIAQRLWKGIQDASKLWTIVTKQTVVGLLGLPQPDDQTGEWQQAGELGWDEIMWTAGIWKVSGPTCSTVDAQLVAAQGRHKRVTRNCA